MEATTRFSKRASTPVLKAANSQTKLLELLVLDDEEIDILENGESARGITLEKIETMSVRELRAALRTAEKDIAAKDRVIETNTYRIGKLNDEIARIAVEAPDETLEALRQVLSVKAYAAEAQLAGHLLPACWALIDHHKAHGGDSVEVLEGALKQVEVMVATVRAECGLIRDVIG